MEFTILGDTTTPELFLRLLLAVALGGVIGYERELHHKPAGFRTHILVSMGSALFTVVSIYGFGPLTGADGQPVRDAARVAAQIVVGIGFLGAGLILHDRDRMRGKGAVHGLTTAASVWMVAAIGMAAGVGMATLAIFTTVIVFLVLTSLERIDIYIKKR